MSEDHSNQDKDFSKRPKKRGGGGPVTTGDYKQSKKPQKDYQVYYESKGGYDKSNKDQSISNKNNYNNPPMMTMALKIPETITTLRINQRERILGHVDKDQITCRTFGKRKPTKFQKMLS